MELVIAEPEQITLGGFTSEVAASTREYLRGWAGLVKPQASTGLSKEEQKALKEQGRAEYDARVATIELGFGDYPLEGACVSVAQAQFVMASLCIQLRLDAWGGRNLPSEEVSYLLEGCCNGMSAHMHKLGVTSADKEAALPVLGAALHAPSGTTANMDKWVGRQVLRLNGRFAYTGMSEYSYFGVDALPYASFYFGTGGGADYEQCRSSHVKTSFWEGHPVNRPVGVVYTQDGVAWFAGYATFKDVVQRRFTRQRAAAVVKHCTGSDTEASKAADRIRAGTSSCDKVVVYPNDVPFGRVYVDLGLKSCMAHSTDAYRTWGDVHPVDVYSSAYFGKGDNGLALIACFADGTATSRGILNTKTGQVVRWYGNHRDWLYVKGTFGIKKDDCALKGAWLALVSDGDEFIGPYVDGFYDHGEVDGDAGRIVLTDCDGHCMDDTGGVYNYCDGEEQLCCLSGGWYPERGMVHQPESDTWYHPDNVGYRTLRDYYTDEYLHEVDAYSVTFEGDTVHFREGAEVPGEWVYIVHRGEYYEGTQCLVQDYYGDWQHEDDVVKNKAGEYVLECDYNEEEDTSNDEDERACA